MSGFTSKDHAQLILGINGIKSLYEDKNTQIAVGDLLNYYKNMYHVTTVKELPEHIRKKMYGEIADTMIEGGIRYGTRNKVL